MLKSCALAITVLLLQSSASYALQSQIPLLIVSQQPLTPNPSTFRWHITHSTADRAGNSLGFESELSETFSSSRDISSITGQLDYYPFGDEFYFTAGAIEIFGSDTALDWTRISDSPAWNGIPLSDLSDMEFSSDMDRLNRYLGAGIFLHGRQSWSLTLQGGAYFGDDHSDRVLISEPLINDDSMMLDDLDRIDSEAVGQRHARHVKPVGHLVFRRRF